MTKFRGFMALVGLLFAGTHLLRHSYVLWVEPRTSVLDQFDEGKKVAGPDKSLEQLIEDYRQSYRELEDKKKEPGSSPEEDYRHFREKPWSTERDLKQAIQERERHARTD